MIFMISSWRQFDLVVSRTSWLYTGAIVIGDHDLRVVLKPIPHNTMNLFLASNSLTNGKSKFCLVYMLPSNTVKF